MINRFSIEPQLRQLRLDLAYAFLKLTVRDGTLYPMLWVLLLLECSLIFSAELHPNCWKSQQAQALLLVQLWIYRLSQ